MNERSETNNYGKHPAKLPPGRSNMSREHVAAHQRARLRAATIDVVARKGYAATTVTDLIAAAGISRTTFYAHYSSKQEAVLAAYERILGDAAGRVIAAYNRPGDWLVRLYAAYDAFAAEVIENPVVARVAIVHILTLGRDAIERGEGLRLSFEANLLANPQLLGGLRIEPVFVTGILSGAWQVVRRRLLEDRVQELQGLGEPILTWAACYAAPATRRLRPRPTAERRVHSPTRAPTPTAPDPLAEPDPRRRILAAAAQLAASEGYDELSPARIIAAAGVDDESFFSNFRSAEECFLAALELVAAQTLAAAVGRARGARDWGETIALGIEALLEHVAEHPEVGALAFVELFAAGQAGIELRERMLKRAEQLFAENVPKSARPAQVRAEAIVGALWGLAYDRVLRGEGHRLPELTEYAAYIALAPVLGVEEAVERIEAIRDGGQPAAVRVAADAAG